MFISNIAIKNLRFIPRAIYRHIGFSHETANYDVTEKKKCHCAAKWLTISTAVLSHEFQYNDSIRNVMRDVVRLFALTTM